MRSPWIDEAKDQSYGKGVMVFLSFLLQCLGVPRANEPPVPGGHKLSCGFNVFDMNS